MSLLFTFLIDNGRTNLSTHLSTHSFCLFTMNLFEFFFLFLRNFCIRVYFKRMQISMTMRHNDLLVYLNRIKKDEIDVD